MSYIEEIRALVGSEPLILAGAMVVIMRDDEVLLQHRRDEGL